MGGNKFSRTGDSPKKEKKTPGTAGGPGGLCAPCVAWPLLSPSFSLFRSGASLETPVSVSVLVPTCLYELACEDDICNLYFPVLVYTLYRLYTGLYSLYSVYAS